MIITWHAQLCQINFPASGAKFKSNPHLWPPPPMPVLGEVGLAIDRCTTVDDVIIEPEKIILLRSGTLLEPQKLCSIRAGKSELALIF